MVVIINDDHDHDIDDHGDDDDGIAGGAGEQGPGRTSQGHREAG